MTDKVTERGWLSPFIVAIHTLGIGQVIIWGTSYYCLGVLAKPIVADTGWSLASVFFGITLALLVMGLISHAVGRLIDTLGARTVMCVGTVIVSLGLVALSLVHDLASYYAAWVVLGIGMRCSLYDAAFAAMVQVAPSRGRAGISYLTLYGAYASSVFWVIGYYTNDWYGWRQTLVLFAITNLLVTLPLNWFGLARREDDTPSLTPETARAATPDRPVLEGRQRTVGMVLFALILSLNSFVFGVVSLQLVPLLESTGLVAGTAVLVASLKGHGQFAGRVVEIVFGRNLKAMTVARIAIGVLPLSLVLLIIAKGDLMTLVAFTLLMGCSQGVISIVRGTVPLELFGAKGYGAALGAIAMPILLINALSPTVFALITETLGWTAAFYIMLACSLVTCVAMELMARWSARAQAEAGAVRATV